MAKTDSSNGIVNISELERSRFRDVDFKVGTIDSLAFNNLRISLSDIQSVQHSASCSDR